MTESDEDFAEAMAAVVEDSYLERLDTETRERVVDHLNARIDLRVNPHELLGLLLVMLDLRPACIVDSKRPTISLEKAEDIADDVEHATTWDPLGQFLECYDVPFELLPNVVDSHADAISHAVLNYHISFDEDRLREFVEANTESPTDDEISRADEQRLGEFLGYPEPAIEAYCDGDQEHAGHLLDALSEEEIEEALGELANMYDSLDLDYREFTRCILPYTVPATVPECLVRVVEDAERTMLGGLVANQRYGCRVFGRVVSDYRERFAPDVE